MTFPRGGDSLSYDASYSAAYYRRNPRRSLEHARRYRARNRRFVQRVKSQLSCAACGERFHYSAMDFHHLVPTDKSRNVSQMAAKNVSIERLKEEIRKCALVCANCHRVFEFNQTTDPEV